MPDLVISLVLIVLTFAAGYRAAAWAFRHQHVAGPHPNGRCWTCGQDVPEEVLSC